MGNELSIFSIILTVVAIVWLVCLLCIPFFLASISSNGHKARIAAQRQVELSERLIEAVNNTVVLLDSIDKNHRK